LLGMLELSRGRGWAEGGDGMCVQGGGCAHALVVHGVVRVTLGE
jgi:hypothetical protein